ncbi:MAG: type 1 glutamine amidotransferase domain-containing protein [Gammaproteobacteria bacterium]|nr:type 1 glutamine amidotransferase domain-containing protein [Gammaproteobacteria bacterium]
MPNTLLIVVTSCDSLRSGRKTGVWFDEFAIPYALFRDKGYVITLASPKGGITPIDPQSLDESITLRGHKTNTLSAKTALNNTKILDEIAANDFDALYIPGGNGTMYDLSQNQTLNQILLRRDEANQLIASVCHGVVCLTALEKNGRPFVQQRKLTCFSNAEEVLTGAEDEYDFLLETRLRELGAEVTTNTPWSEHIVMDGKLITGQNPQSCQQLAKVIVNLLT